MNNLLSFISLCRKAQKLKMGFDSVLKTLPETYLVLFTSDISPKTREKVLFAMEDLRFKCKYFDLPFTSDEIHFTIGKKVAVLSITDRGLAKAVLTRLNQSSPTQPLQDCSPIKEEFNI